jgi:hypothetical protein
MSMHSLHGRSAALLAGACLIAILGCADDTGISKRFPVSGTVNFKGQPLEKGRIDFIPVDSAKCRPATGEIQDGYYTLTTLSPGDGAIPGQYKVTVTAKNVDTSKVLATVQQKGGGGRQHEIAKAQSLAKSVIPAKYSLDTTSGLTATVAEQSNKIPFELTEN